MKVFSIALVLTGLCLQQASAVSWYFLRWYTPDSTAQFLTFNVDLVAPALKEAGTFYVWPGLQDLGGTGVYQEVLDGRSGEWWIGAGWCCSNPTLAWGAGFNTPNGDSIAITNNLESGTWVSTIAGAGSSVTDSFALGVKNMNQALLAIEIYDATWDFGQVVWNNVEMVVNTTETAWCTNAPANYDTAMTYTSTTPKATVSGGKTTCTISQIVFVAPLSTD